MADATPLRRFAAMPANSHLAFTIAGQDTTPEGIRLRDLLLLLADLETAVIATARHMGADGDDTFLGLQEISNGSAVYELSATAPAQLAAERISTAINRRDSALLPQQAVECLNEIQKRSFRMGKSFQLNNGQFQARIEPSFPLFSDALVVGATSLFGTLVAVGGARPTAKLRLSDGQLFTAEVPTHSLAQNLGKMLYRELELEGEAWWHAATMELRRFRVKRVGTYDFTTPSQAFADLASIAPGLWEDIDPDTYINEQRSDVPQ